MKRLLPFLYPYKKLLMIGPAFKLLEAILELMLPFFMSKIIDKGIAERDTNYIIRMGIMMLLTAVIGIFCAMICQYCAAVVSQACGTDIRNAMFHHIGTFSNTEMDNFGTPSLINRITNDVNQVQLSIAMLIRLVIRAPFLCVGGLVMAFIMDARLSVIMLTMLPVYVLFLYLTMRKTVPLYHKLQEKLDRITRILRENIRGIRVIRAFARAAHEKRRFAFSNEEFMECAVRVGRISALLNPLTNLVMNSAIIAILWFGGLRVNQGGMHVGGIIAYISYVAQILSALVVISNLVVIFTRAFACADRIGQVLDTKPSIVSGTLTNDGSMGAYAIEFQDVSMSYGSKSGYDLKHITFRVRHGETVGIIGGTGSGKTTLVNLIPRFYDSAKGRVLIDGRDVKGYRIQELRAKMGVVPQNNVLFTGTIEENIRWGKGDASEEEVKNAARIAQASEFIEKLPHSYQARIAKGGTNVSGGQRQRLAIARAIVRRPKILILDDSFNALDFATDLALRKALKQESEGMTTLIVSQRASTLKDADQIIVLNEGEIAGIGTHEVLYSGCEVYREIVESQQQKDEVHGI